MYNTKYTCLYNPLDENIDIEKQNVLYRKDILNIFSIDKFNETIINNTLTDILDTLKTYDDFYICLDKMRNISGMNHLGISLLLLYSFDYLYLTHPCICEFLETGSINPEKIRILLKVID